MKYINVNITNNKELNKFYSKLRLYKLFFNGRLLKLNISDAISLLDKEELLMCEKAFNIKDKDERLVYVYDAICDFHDRLYINNNICEFDKDGNCIARRNGECKVKHNGCCGSCKYLGNYGCTTKCMACKGFFCRYIRNKKGVVSIKKQKLFKIFLSRPQKQIGMANYWSSRDDTLKIMRRNSYLANFIMKESKLRRL